MLICTNAENSQSTATINNTSPTAPLLNYPTDNLTVTTQELNVSWNASIDLNGDTITYFLDYSVDNGTLWNPIISTTNTTYKWELGSLSDGTLYKVKITPNDGTSNGTSNISGTFTITLERPQPSQGGGAGGRSSGLGVLKFEGLDGFSVCMPEETVFSIPLTNLNVSFGDYFPIFELYLGDVNIAHPGLQWTQWFLKYRCVNIGKTEDIYFSGLRMWILLLLAAIMGLAYIAKRYRWFVLRK